MGRSAESTGSRTHTLVAVINVLLIGFLAAVSVLTVVGSTAGPASANHGFINTDAVTQGRQIRFTFSSVMPRKYVDASLSGTQSWDAVGVLNFVKDDTLGPTEGTSYSLIYKPSNDFVGTTVSGMYVPFAGRPDVIYLYTKNVDRLNPIDADRRWLGRHETGHATGLKHPVEIFVDQQGEYINKRELAAAQDCCVMHTAHVLQGNPNAGVYYLTNHDRNHEFARWN